MPTDSIGVKVVDGKSYIMHKVSKGEGVYGIAKKYGVPAADIFAANEGSKTTIKIDQILLVPKSGLSMASKTGSGSGSGDPQGNPAASKGNTKTEKTYHTVAAGQTLSFIARKYNTTVAEIKSLNNLKSDNIALGQKLIVAESATKVADVAPKPVVETPKPEPKPEPVVKTPDAVVAPPVVSNNNVVVTNKSEASESNDKQSQVVNTYSTDDGDEISESGTAIISSEGELNQERSFIMHPSAKVGTIVMITNTTNNNTVFARVVANCKCDSGTILKMSKTVANKLGVNDNIQVKLSYAK